MTGREPPVVLVDPLTGAPVIITASRQHRPNEGPGAMVTRAAGAATGCPFCPGGLEAPEHYDVRWFVNRWPAMDGDRCEVILYTPDHNASFAGLGQDGARRVVDLWADRTAALGARTDVGYVLIFENRGAQVGATIAHPHGQIYAFAGVPPVPTRELSATPCPLCAETAENRLVAEAPGWRAWVPAAAAWPFAITVAPVDHRPDLPSLADDERDALAALLVDVLGRLDRLFDAPMPYFLWIHQRPTDGQPWPNAHLHVEICPLYRAPGTPRFVASGELGSGIFFNPVAPDEAARRLRDAEA
ncbi:MAG: galactose-1-phosphate uridylyltransferase [Acidimicrobiales bacterium]